MANFLTALIPTRCAGCNASSEIFCAACIESVRAPTIVAALPTAVVLGEFDGPLRKAIHALKFRGATALTQIFAQALAERVRATSLTKHKAINLDAVTFIPTSPARRRHRGFDQAKLLALALGQALEIRTIELVVRSGASRGRAPQSELTRLERINTEAHTFLIRQFPPQHLLVVDDVITTGATMKAALRPLTALGNTCLPVAIASTPRR